jgi:hypothetical protein
MKSLRNIFQIIAFVMACQLANATNYYVSPTGNDTKDGKTESTAFKTAQKAANLTLPGDTVFFMTGTFAVTNTFLAIYRSGSSSAWIVYKALKGNTPKVKVSGSVWSTILISANYIVFENIELEGNLQNLKLADAEASEAEAEAGGTNWTKYAVYNNGGITLGGNDSPGNHHIIVRNCKIHDFPGGGIQGIKSDYVTVENNLIYNVNWYTMYASSAISLWHTYNSDMETGYKNFVRGNICYNSKTLVKWISCKCMSDGNGIIIDDNRQTQAGALGTAYVGRTLVENNVCFNNGGSGIHAYSSNHVDIINNTTFNNGTVVGYAEIFQSDASDGLVINNIMYSRDGGKVNSNSNTSNVTFDYNIYFNGSADVTGLHDKFINPLFVNASIDPAIADFHLLNGSPAIDYGTSVFALPAITPTTDYDGNSRPIGNGIDAGAYESPYYSTSNTCFVISPSNGESFKEATNISLTAIANTESGSISKIEFYQGITKIGESTTYPYSFQWINPPVGDYSISARAYDNNSNVAVSDGIIVRITSSASIQKIVNGEFDNGTNNWFVNAWNSATAALTIDAGSILSGINSGAISVTALGVNAYEAQLKQAINLVKGRKYVLTFSAKSSLNRSMSVWIQKNASPYTTYYSQTASVTTNAQNFGPYSFTASVTESNCSLEFILGNVLGNLWVDNVSLTEVDNSPKPDCTITSPTAGTNFDNPVSIVLQANATVSTGTISKVDFYIDNQFIGTDKAKPFTSTWTGIKNGNYILTARATDASGNITTSPIVNITISNINTIEKIENQTIGIFPNPAKDFFIVRNSGNEAVKIVSVYNLGGQLLIDTQNPAKLPVKINSSTLRSGFYLVKVATSTQNYSFKLVKE